MRGFKQGTGGAQAAFGRINFHIDQEPIDTLKMLFYQNWSNYGGTVENILQDIFLSRDI